MVLVVAIGGGEVDVPFALEEVEFGGPDLFGVGAGFWGGPDGMFLAEGSEVFGGVNVDATVGIGNAPEVAVGRWVRVPGDPGIGAAADGVDELIGGKGSGFFEGGVGGIDRHFVVPGSKGMVEAGDDVGVLRCEVF